MSMIGASRCATIHVANGVTYVSAVGQTELVQSGDPMHCTGGNHCRDRSDGARLATAAAGCAGRVAVVDCASLECLSASPSSLHTSHQCHCVVPGCVRQEEHADNEEVTSSAQWTEAQELLEEHGVTGGTEARDEVDEDEM